MSFKPHKYVKDTSYDPIYKEVNRSFYFKSQLMPSLMMSLGIVLMATQVVFPLVVYTNNPEDAKPMSGTVLGAASGFREFEFDELENSPKETTLKSANQNIPKYFYLTVPELGIKDAVVETNSNTLSPDKSLGHYKNTGLPGEIGTSFIYGHSVLPIFYNPKNYKAIFSTIHKLDEGDEFSVNYNNNEFKYKIVAKRILKPTEVNPLAKINPDYLGKSNMTLMTCYPPGTKEKRLMVDAELITTN